jgi:hypothetical protein
MPNALPPILVTDLETGTLRLLSSFPEHLRALFENLISEEDMRCIWLDGHAYVAWDDVAPYTHEDGWDMDLISTELAEKIQSSDPLKTAIEQQGKSDDAVLRTKARLVAMTASVPDTAAHPFAHALQWHGFWNDDAFVATSLAGEAEAASMCEAFKEISGGVNNGAANDLGVQAFHKALLSVVDPTFERSFAEIWSKGGVTLPNDPEKQRLALAALGQLTTMFNGGRGNPEGADTPRRAMTRYMANVSLVPGA